MIDMHNATWNRQTIPAGPHGWIQWKGTDVCMDIHCECGVLTHIDASFCYFVTCGACGRRYFVNGHVELVPLLPTETDVACMATSKVVE